MKVIILMGAPGSGKGSSAKLLQSELKIPHLSTGDILRSEISKITTLGLKVSNILEKGNLISDEIMTELIESRLNQVDTKNGFILDGFPRTLLQAQELDKIFDKLNIKDYVVIELSVDTDVLTKRILGRYTCNVCGTIYNKYFSLPKVSNKCDVCGNNDFSSRNDDNEETIVNRLCIYNQETLPVIQYYKNKNKCYTINGLLNKEEILEKILELFNNS